MIDVPQPYDEIAEMLRVLEEIDEKMRVVIIARRHTTMLAAKKAQPWRDFRFVPSGGSSDQLLGYGRDTVMLQVGHIASNDIRGELHNRDCNDMKVVRV